MLDKQFGWCLWIQHNWLLSTKKSDFFSLFIFKPSSLTVFVTSRTGSLFEIMQAVINSTAAVEVFYVNSVKHDFMRFLNNLREGQ